MRPSNLLLNTVISWAVYGFILTIIMYLREYLPHIIEGRFNDGPTDVILEIAKTYIRILLLIFTAFVIYGFLRMAFGHLKWMQSEYATIGRIAVLYVLVTCSYLVTYMAAYQLLPRGIVIDAPLMNAATMLLFAIIPYFRENTFQK